MNAPLDRDDLGAIPDPYAAADLAPAPPLDLEAFAPSPTRAAVRRRRVAALFGSVVALSAIVGAMGLRSAFDPRVVGLGIALPIVMATSLLALVSSSRSPVARGALVLAGAALTLVVANLVTVGAGDASAAAMIRCLRAGAVLAAVPLVLSIAAMRHSFVSGATWRTAALGVMSGFVGAAALRLHCPNDEMVHLSIGHGVPIVLAVAAAVAFGPRFTRA